MPSPLIWVPIKQSGNPSLPAPRSGHSLINVGKQYILFGGLDCEKKNGKISPNNQVYVLRLMNNNNCEWRLQPTSGDVPFPRANHSACAIGPDRMLIFGGYYSSNQRFNDTYILKTTNWQWSQPPNQKSGSEPKNIHSKIGAPDPRANHTATFYKGKVYIFGGHGGVSYQRKTFNDLYSLDCETFEWTQLEPTGNTPPPDPRGGHTAALLPNKILIYGGWSNQSQFANMMIYDILKNEWIDPEILYDIPRWNHCGVMVEAIPTWKYFIFGGSVGSFDEGAPRSLGKFTDDVHVLDILSYESPFNMKWSVVPLELSAGQNHPFKPKARESASIFYEPGESRLVLFGGWNNNWLGDIYGLSVGTITGPPYAIFSISPKLGPYTGHTKVTIQGVGFVNTQGILVRFSTGKQQVDVQGNYVSDTEIVCDTPSFEAFGPKDVEVRLSLDRGDYTTTFSKFSYFLNTKAEKTISYGPGLLPNNPIKHETVFFIQARNQNGQNRTSGTDEFVVKIDQVGKEEPVPFTIKDLDNGSYEVRYTLQEEGEAKIQVSFKNEKNELQPIRGSPFTQAAFSAKAPVSNSELTGPSISAYIQDSLTDIDKFINETKTNINIKNKNLSEDVGSLLKVKENLNLINSKKDDTVLKLDTLEQLLQTLEALNISKASDLNKNAKLQEEFGNLQKLAANVEKEISPNMKTEAEKTKAQLKKFEEELKQYYSDIKKESFYQYKTGVEDSFKCINKVEAQIEKHNDNLQNFEWYSKMFGFSDDVVPVQKSLDQIKTEVKAVRALWSHTKKCEEIFLGYKQKKWAEINSADMEDEVKKLRKEWMDLRGLDKKSTAYTEIGNDLKKWAIFLPLLGELKDPAMVVEDHRHWDKVKKLTKRDDFEITDETKLEVVWDLKLYEVKDGIEEIADQAKQEAKMDKILKKIDERWKEVVFDQVPHKDTPILTLKMSDDNVDALDENQLQIQNLSSSKFLAYFEVTVLKWKNALANVSEVVQLLAEVQKSWSFLESLFIHSEEVKKELPNESERFVVIDKEVKQILADGCQMKNILKFCNQEGIFKKLENVQKELTKCEKALNEFLDGKRKAFPRFYFVSVNDLLDILSNGNNPMKINKHMSKIFQAIENLDLKEIPNSRPQAIGFNSCVGKEYVGFEKPLDLQGKVESYLDSTINKMISVLTEIANNSFKICATMSREEWLKRDPAQITLLVNMIIWVQNVENGFHKVQGGNLDAMKVLFKEQVESLTALIRMVQGELERSLRQKVMCLITMDTHSRDIIDRLIQENVRKAEEFQWQSQLKFYWDAQKNDCRINIADAQLWYGYEYLGNGPRLVVTPLTDRIYVTATQALHLKMGCAPAGPAGTGKTETTKDLASAAGKACYVFNCSSEMNYESMGNIFKGLAASGCWGCFDEFNRLEPAVLSVCSVQFKAVTDAIKYQKTKFTLQDDEISLNPTCGVFITMNPGYLGRSELPEGLKSLFRPITVVVPDLELICENMLMAEGFIDAKILATKFTVLYALCRDLLSKQLHYDWGLRAIKSVLVVAGGFKRAEQKIGEQALLMRALRDFNMPKIVAADYDIFMGLLGDLFPNIKIERKRDMEFEAVIENMCKESKLYPEPEFIKKVVQLSELLEIRHCVFVMGPAGSGKSSTWKTLAKSQDKLGKKTTWVDLDPKVVSTKDLYGYIMLATKEWKDGLLSKTMRSLGEITDTNPKWIVLDGDLDANWIESMNSVMDDNKILTLASNERIPLKPHMRMLFEIRDLVFATPATVSRAGILYISDDEGHQWASYIKSWIAALPVDNTAKETLQGLFNKYVAAALFYIKRNCQFLLPVSQMAMVISLCKGLQTLVTQPTNLEYVFVWVLVWALGGALTEKDGVDYKKNFSDWWKNEMKTVKFPSKGTIFDYFVDTTPEGQVRLEEWTKKVETIEYDGSVPMQTITVPTSDSVSIVEFVKNFMFVGQPVLLIGLAGCGKTQVAKGLLKDISKKMPDSFSYMAINFNYYTDSQSLQNMLESPLIKVGRQWAPPGKGKLIYFVDDLNMPQLDLYNTQTSIALLRQIADYSHWYDVNNKLLPKEISNIQFMAAMNPSAGSFFVNPRYQRHFWTCSISFPQYASLIKIYSTFLTGHFKKFKPALGEQIQPIINAALTLHNSVVEKFRKTAINFHYEFNMRHLAGIFQGLLLANPAQFQDPEKLVKLWIHESERTYGDRLVSLDHLGTYKAIVGDLVKKTFSKFTYLTRYFQKDNAESLVFCNFVNGIQNERFYDIMLNDKLEGIINEALKEYNDNNAVMDLVLFEDAMKHVCRITRIVSQPSGHALLIGVGGSGKQSLAKLSSFICGYTTFQITISQSYGMNELRTDLQGLYNKCGAKEEGILFLFNDGQITNEKFLVYLNDLLSSGEIAELYTKEEKETIVNLVRPKVKNDGKIDTPENCWIWFIEKVKANLHMALCFSPVGEAFRRRARQFPALVNCTVIDWFQPWPEKALEDVADSFLKNLELGVKETRDAVVKFMPFSFKSVNSASLIMLEQERRYIYTTPKSFLELIKLFTTMLNQRRTSLEKSVERYENGLIKLRETAEMVAKLEEELKVKQVEVDQKKAEADAVAETVGREKAKVEKENDKANIEAEKTSKMQREVEQQQTENQKDVDAAMPLVHKAEAALSGIVNKDLQNAKSWANPPKGIPEVFGTCVYLLAGVAPPEMVEIDPKSRKPKDVSWKACQKMLANPEKFKSVMQKSADFVREGKITAQNINPIRPFLTEDYFDPVAISSKSQAASGVCNFIKNIVLFFDVILNVEPKIKALEEATKQLEAANAALQEINAVVAKLKSELAKLEAEFDKALAEKNAVVAEAERCQLRLGLAQRLVGALGSENERWAQSIVDLQKSLEFVVGDVLLAASFVSYVGPFTKKFREMLIKDYFLKFMKERKILMSPNPNPMALLIDDAVKAQWNNQGLPSDQVSTENGTILVNSERYPLMIDPQLQGITWIKEKEKKNNLQITRLGRNDLIRVLEMSIENGYSVLIENMDEQVDAVLGPVIARNYIKRGKNKILKFGGKDLVLSDKFRLFLHTKLANPHYPPEIHAESTLINFTVTEDGLGDQLLTLVVGKERPDLAKMKIELIKQQNEFKIKLKELEDGLLYKLANAPADILSDVELIENLEFSKKISLEIKEKVAIAQKTEIMINEASEAYRQVASRGALIFFLMNDLNKIHSFYMYSLDSFVIVVNRAIDSLSEGEKKPVQAQPVETTEPKEGEEIKEAEPKEGEIAQPVAEQKEDVIALSPRSLNRRVEKLTEVITYYAFSFVRRGLFERHKLIVSSMLTLRIQQRQGKLTADEVNHLVTGKIELKVPPIPDPIKSFINDAMWGACVALEGIQALQGFLASLESDSLQWKKWYGEERAESSDLPKQFKEVSKFYRLLFLRAMRPDRISSALTFYVSETMGERYVEQQPFSMEETYKETNASTPIFFVLFPGVDPTPDVERIGAMNDVTAANGKFVNISMGQGQENRARDAISRAAKEGTWIMLQNLHLMQGWLKLFEGYLEKAVESANPNFRCFISSEPPPVATWKIIPESILQNCVKVANEAPQDLRANLRRAYAKFSEERIQKSTKPNEYKAILFGLCTFHSLILGRKKFGYQGWSRVYNFNDGDLTICADVLHNYLERYDVVPYDDLRYIYGEIMYGGHITDGWDRRTCNTYLKVLIRPELLTKDFNLAQGFKSPDPSRFDYEAYKRYIEEKLPQENPQMFGMHPNAEIGYLTTMCESIFNTIVEVQGGSSSGGGSKKDDGVTTVLNDIKTRLPKQYILLDILGRIKDKSPYVVVCLQECERMNGLLSEIERSLKELEMGLQGALNITDAMEGLSRALSLNRVPESWEKAAYPSRKGLALWFADLIDRTVQLHEWTKEMVMPKSLCIAWLFNPMSFLTAIMQVTARSKGLPLDDMVLQTNVTTMKGPEEVMSYAENGFYVHGLYVEGASWELGAGGNEGYLTDAKLKELHPKLPVVNVISVKRADRKKIGQYECPVYVTSLRGATYVFTSNLQMENEDSDPNKWVLAGVALLMSDD